MTSSNDNDMHYYVYIIECTNLSYYTGYTTDIARRYAEHCNGSIKCKYTRSFPPKRLAACWKISCDLASILKIERGIKQLSKADKQQLITFPATLRQLDFYTTLPKAPRAQALRALDKFVQ